MKTVKYWIPLLSIGMMTSSLGLVGCSKSDDQAKAAASQQMPTPEVGVIVAQPESVDNSVELSGRISAYQTSDVRPQTSGVILKRLFTEGSYVKEGQPLYSIDDRTNLTNVDSARAALVRQQANLNALRVKAGRYRQLLGTNAIAQQDYDDVDAQVKLAEADVASSQAALKNSQINLQYSTVRAPISGQTGRSSVTAGALVTANQAQALVTIQQRNPVYVDITQSSTDLLKLRQQLSQGKLDQTNNTRVKLRLEDGSYYPIEGKLAFSDASVDQNTGSVVLRAVFDNPNYLLLPGMFANAEIIQSVIPNAYVIPQVAVARTPTGQATVMLVNAKGVVETRIVTTAGTKGKNWIISAGLNPGDKVIVDGVAKIKEGMPVKAAPYTPDATQANSAIQAAQSSASHASAQNQSKDTTAAKQ